MISRKFRQSFWEELRIIRI